MKKKKKIQKDYFIEKGEVLVGSSLLRKKVNFSNRVSYILDNMKFNKAFLFAKEKIIKGNDDKELLETLKNKYKKYREDWNNQPKNCIKKNFLGHELEKNKTLKRINIKFKEDQNSVINE